jgi:non-heme chloroperoxidase
MHLHQKETTMPAITTRDGTSIYFKDWGKGQPVLFSHGWPLSADAFDDQMFFLAQRGYRTIALDRRGFGRSSQPWNGYDYDTFADDLAELIEKLDLKNVILVAHSMGGGEVVRYVARHGSERVAAVVTFGAVPPLMLKTPSNPEGQQVEVFDNVRKGIVEDASQFWRDLSLPFYGANRPGAKVSQGVRDSFWRQGIMASLKGAYDCVKAWSETDFTEDLTKIDVPMLIVHGDDDQIVPIEASALKAVKLVRGAELKIIKGAPHGLCTTHKHEVNNILLSFIEAKVAKKAAA